MKKYIRFDHEGRTDPAVAIYDSNEINDAILIKPLQAVNELDDSILLVSLDDIWIADCCTLDIFSTTYSNIIDQIDQTFKKQLIVHEVYAQQFLS